jgi:F-type H+-transporting ATPase subunit O
LTLSANGRLGDSVKVINAYQELLQASRGAVDVTIISAEALKKKQVETIQSAVVKFVGADKSVDVKLQVDPSILGGLQILIGDRFLDLSVSSRVADLTKTLESSV